MLYSELQKYKSTEAIILIIIMNFIAFVSASGAFFLYAIINKFTVAERNAHGIYFLFFFMFFLCAVLIVFGIKQYGAIQIDFYESEILIHKKKIFGRISLVKIEKIEIQYLDIVKYSSNTIDKSVGKHNVPFEKITLNPEFVILIIDKQMKGYLISLANAKKIDEIFATNYRDVYSFSQNFFYL